MERLKFTKEFTEFPGTRSRDISDNSGEEFYEDVLRNWYIRAKEKGVNLSIDLDGAAGYPRSFLDEAFGRLGHEFGLEDVKNRLEIVSTSEKDLAGVILQSVAEWSKDGVHYNSALAKDIELKESNYFSSVKRNKN